MQTLAGVCTCGENRLRKDEPGLATDRAPCGKARRPRTWPSRARVTIRLLQPGTKQPGRDSDTEFLQNARESTVWKAHKRHSAPDHRLHASRLFPWTLTLDRSHVRQRCKGAFGHREGCQGHNGGQEGRQEEACVPFSSCRAAVPCRKDS